MYSASLLAPVPSPGKSRGQAVTIFHSMGSNPLPPSGHSDAPGVDGPPQAVRVPAAPARATLVDVLSGDVSPPGVCGAAAWVAVDR